MSDISNELKARSKNPLKPKAPFKWDFMDIIPEIAPKRLTSEITFSIYILLVGAYSKIPKLYSMERITTEEVMDKLDMLKSRFGKIDGFLMVGFGNNFSRCRYAIYLHGVTVQMSNPWCSFYVSRSGTSRNKRTS